jgi:hypothetical protein
MSESQKMARETFEERIKSYGVKNTDYSEAHDSLYVWAGESGYGVPKDCYDDLDVRMTESIGMSSLDETHRLYREDAHHVLIFTVMDDE